MDNEAVTSNNITSESIEVAIDNPGSNPEVDQIILLFKALNSVGAVSTYASEVNFITRNIESLRTKFSYLGKVQLTVDQKLEFADAINRSTDEGLKANVFENAKAQRDGQITWIRNQIQSNKEIIAIRELEAKVLLQKIDSLKGKLETPPDLDEKHISKLVDLITKSDLNHPVKKYLQSIKDEQIILHAEEQVESFLTHTKLSKLFLTREQKRVLRNLIQENLDTLPEAAIEYITEIRNARDLEINTQIANTETSFADVNRDITDANESIEYLENILPSIEASEDFLSIVRALGSRWSIAEIINLMNYTQQNYVRNVLEEQIKAEKAKLKVAEAEKSLRAQAYQYIKTKIDPYLPVLQQSSVKNESLGQEERDNFLYNEFVDILIADADNFENGNKAISRNFIIKLLGQLSTMVTDESKKIQIGEALDKINGVQSQQVFSSPQLTNITSAQLTEFGEWIRSGKQGKSPIENPQLLELAEMLRNPQGSLPQISDADRDILIEQVTGDVNVPAPLFVNQSNLSAKLRLAQERRELWIRTGPNNIYKLIHTPEDGYTIALSKAGIFSDLKEIESHLQVIANTIGQKITSIGDNDSTKVFESIQES